MRNKFQVPFCSLHYANKCFAELPIIIPTA